MINFKQLFCFRHAFMTINKQTCGQVADQLRKLYPGLGVFVDQRHMDVEFIKDFVTIKYRGEILELREGFGKPFIILGDQICVKCGKRIDGLGTLPEFVHRAMDEVDNHLENKHKALKMWSEQCAERDNS